MHEIEMQELRLKCRKLSDAIRLERMTLIEGIMEHRAFGVLKDTRYLDGMLIRLDAIKEIVKWY